MVCANLGSRSVVLCFLSKQVRDFCNAEGGWASIISEVVFIEDWRTEMKKLSQWVRYCCASVVPFRLHDVPIMLRDGLNSSKTHFVTSPTDK